jgi:F420-dependent oxidoreductase-like protein
MRLSIWPGTDHPFDELAATAAHAEQTGWDGIWLADHFMPDTADGTRPLTPRLEAWTTLAAIAARTDRLRLGVLVSGNTYRHPAIVAKMSTTVDTVSGGRHVLGLGSGWQQNEHDAYGIELPAVPERLDRLEEACEVITSLLRNERTNFAGRYYHLVDAPCEPKPVAGGLGVPLLIGGGGERVTLRIAARYADEWNTWGLPQLIAHKMTVLERHCETIGRDPGSIERSAQVIVHLADDPDRLRQLRGQETPVPAMIGTATDLAEIVASYRAIGLDELIVPDRSLGDTVSERLELMDRLKEEVVSPSS